jgi:hypothetical protein
MQYTHFFYLFLIEFCYLILAARAWRYLSKFCTPFGHHIMGVFFRRSKSKMLRIATRWMIALMQHPKSFWYRSVRYLKSNSVGLKRFIFDCEYTVSKMASSTVVGPTGVFTARFINFFPNVLLCICFAHKNTKPTDSQVKSALLGGKGISRFLKWCSQLFEATSRPTRDYKFQSTWSTV